MSLPQFASANLRIAVEETLLRWQRAARWDTFRRAMTSHCCAQIHMTLEEIRADIIAIQNEAEGLLDELVQGAAR